MLSLDPLTAFNTHNYDDCVNVVITNEDRAMVTLTVAQHDGLLRTVVLVHRYKIIVRSLQGPISVGLLSSYHAIQFHWPSPYEV